uniref:CbbX n=1 Tax=Haramonas pauciplastida TaxID=478668 RepID=UPI0021146CBF|nr:CbbX [Haramonas pauciplastida]UTE94943.1 CbbX [Haramonas pauciplastida]
MINLNIKKEYEESNVDETIRIFNEEIIGLKNVKKRIQEISALLINGKLRAKAGYTNNNPGLHMSFTGNPGTGKTVVALKMGEILYKLGYSRKGHLVSVSREHLVGQYIGHTAPKTKEVLKSALGGLLFIDEAYYLYKPNNECDYGAEAIEILLQVMENQRDDLVVILAGYKHKMQQFYKSNPGLSSRISNHIYFEDYTHEELLQIAKKMVDEQQYTFSNEVKSVLLEYIKRRVERPRFANARSIRNAIDRIKMRQAKRMFDDGNKLLTKYDLVNFTSNDILKSSLFIDL